jgi:hypothetical protein
VSKGYSPIPSLNTARFNNEGFSTHCDQASAMSRKPTASSLAATRTAKSGLSTAAVCWALNRPPLTPGCSLASLEFNCARAI